MFADFRTEGSGPCPAHEIAREAGLLDNGKGLDLAKPSCWHQIRTVVFRDTELWTQMERLMKGYVTCSLPHPRHDDGLAILKGMKAPKKQTANFQEVMTRNADKQLSALS